MAEGGGLLDQDQFSCAICLDLLKDPTTIPCGHSYCMGCIKGCWNHTGVYKCPQCRKTFTSRPVLNKNTMLTEVVEKLKKTGNIPKLIDASGNLQENICSHHHKQLEIYCRKDEEFLCNSCDTKDHKGHRTVSVATARAEKQKQLGTTQSKFQKRIQEREKELQDLRPTVQSLKRSAQAAVEDSERIFTEMIRSIERRRSEVKELIRDQEKAAVSQAEGFLERLEQEIAELRRRDAELEQLSHTEDHIHFLQSFKSLCVPPGPGDLPSIAVSPQVSFEAVRKCVSELKRRLEDVCKGEMSRISRAGRAVGDRGCFSEKATCFLCRQPFRKPFRSPDKRCISCKSGIYGYGGF
ncbi:E3 ubiquitin-protein ligase TRIM47-like [Conger conger]|uniref:E3 ubiquitin-protein ligase TRIM47-like n=1 Tax=Conger conger TaxID=82655 RepID=UPI002A5A1272|nr:E3 ubiquitin-protein ligase TRIM47-like [Conger conger]